MGRQQQGSMWRQYDSRLYRCEEGHLCIAAGSHRVDDMHAQRVFLTQWRLGSFWSWMPPAKVLDWNLCGGQPGSYEAMANGLLYRYAGACGAGAGRLHNGPGCRRAFMPRWASLGHELARLRSQMHAMRDVLNSVFATGGELAVAQLAIAELDLAEPVFATHWEACPPERGPVQVKR